ncbi:hypothetical protein LCI18_012916 [Fusarium solani-melongenae]|uniref:Uncharacterized protein n=1 Tax=Fusarium solani subsp. cucurbitae TaxID=2747967 RepID=A0ACD3ZLA2_FUSSC|nr:hypothetical protein LCI18_012916 [Fusarium solani-melongenae]
MLEIVWKLRHITPSLEFGPASGQEQSLWLEPVLSDVACFHFTMFISKMYLDYLEGHTGNTQNALTHHTKALNALQRRLSAGNMEISTSDPTVLTVVGLTTAALAFGDVDIAQKHMRGLHKMVTLRGGISTFSHDKRLQTKICRVDLGVSLSTGCEPLFFSEELSWSSYLPPQASKKTQTAYEVSSDLLNFLASLDARLRLVWDDLKTYSQSANIAAHGGLDMDTMLYQEVMVSAHYRLIRLRFELGTINGTICLALLAFASSVFLQGGGVWIRHEHLYRQLKKSFAVAKDRKGDLPPQVKLWLYVFCVAFDTHKPSRSWLRSGLAELLQSQGLRSWDGVRASLKSVLWVNKIHDAIARNFVEEMLSTAENGSQVVSELTAEALSHGCDT